MRPFPLYQYLPRRSLFKKKRRLMGKQVAVRPQDHLTYAFPFFFSIQYLSQGPKDLLREKAGLQFVTVSFSISSLPSECTPLVSYSFSAAGKEKKRPPRAAAPGLLYFLLRLVVGLLLFPEEEAPLFFG